MPYGRPLDSARATETIRSIPVFVARDIEPFSVLLANGQNAGASTQYPGPYALCRESSAMASHGDKGEGDDAVERIGNRVDSNRRQSDSISDWEIVNCAQYVGLTDWAQCS